MKRLKKIIAVVFFGLGLGAVHASDHRESPLIQGDPKADITDFYAFLNPHDSSKLVMVLNVSPFQVTVQEGAYHFDPGVRYRFNVDNDGDAKPDRIVDFKFSEYNVTTHKQTFEAKFSDELTVRGEVTEGTRFTPAPNPPKIVDGPDGIRIFVGPRNDPFFVDTVGVIRTFAGTGRFTGTDALAGYNISAIVLELPLSMVMASNTTLGMWTETARRTAIYRRTSNPNTPIVEYVGPYRQIQRAGNPAIKVIFVPDELKDFYNVTRPWEQPEYWATVLNQALHQPRFAGLSEDYIQKLISIFVPDTLKLDITKPVKYPNGRALDDDIVDLIFEPILNVGIPIFYAPGQLDGVNHNDVTNSTEFPYLAPPHQAP